ncbi:hypothetical protein DFH11DRAFT_1154771 [Phellopilus nigrolimitatus]|nr:hypothetical protein DFH11DRAFT_1154771 [Phellopilus nigrolimitatus]
MPPGDEDERQGPIFALSALSCKLRARQTQTPSTRSLTQPQSPGLSRPPSRRAAVGRLRHAHERRQSCRAFRTSSAPRTLLLARCAREPSAVAEYLGALSARLPPYSRVCLSKPRLRKLMPSLSFSCCRPDVHRQARRLRNKKRAFLHCGARPAL